MLRLATATRNLKWLQIIHISYKHKSQCLNTHFIFNISDLIG